MTSNAIVNEAIFGQGGIQCIMSVSLSLLIIVCISVALWQSVYGMERVERYRAIIVIF